MGHFGQIMLIVFLNKLIPQALASTSSPTISYCFYDNLLIPKTFLEGCRLVQISNSTFEFGNLKQNTVEIPSSETRRLLLKCTGPTAVVWRVWNFVGAIRLIPVQDVKYYEGDSRTAEISRYAQWLSIELEMAEDFSSRLRCQSFTDAESVADVYVNTRGKWGHLRSWRSAERVPGGYSIQLGTTTPRSHIIPFVANEFVGDYMQRIKFIRKPFVSHSIHAVSDNCVSCICKASCGTFPCDSTNFCNYKMNARIFSDSDCDLTRYDFGTTHWSREYAQRVTTNNLNQFTRGQDCNHDGIISCEDFARLHFWWFSACDGRHESPAESILATDFANCLVEVKENFTVLNFNSTNYDPRIGLRVADAPDELSTYEATYDNSRMNRRSSRLSPIIEAPVYVTYDKVNRTFNCNNTQTDPFLVSFHGCTSLPECIFEFEHMHPGIFDISTSGCLHLGYRLNQLNQSVLSNGCSEWKTLGLFTTCARSYEAHGFAKCYQDYRLTGHQHTMGQSDYFFTGLDGDKYLFSNFSTESVIRISAINQDSWTDEFQEFECLISTFVLQPVVVFRVKYVHGDTEDFKQSIAKAPSGFTARLENDSAATLAVHLGLKVSDGMSKLSCRVPTRHLKDWTSAEITIAFRGKKWNEFALIGIAAAVIIIILATMIVWIKLWRKYSCSEASEMWRTACKTVPGTTVAKRRLTEEDVYEFYHGARSQVLNDTIIVPENLAFKEDLKISRSEITIGNIVRRKGKFDIFHQGVFVNQRVTVKSCVAQADIEYLKSFLKELKVMAHIGEHRNIIKFFGAVVDDIENGIAFAVLELSPYGSLGGYLRRQSSTNGASDFSRVQYGSSGNEIELSTMLGQPTLISFCKQIASGMKYIAEKKGIHADLAARNVLVFEGNIVKITDFGQSTKLYAYSNYINQIQTPLPWQWMALESLRFMELSSQSDVWSFGVTVWEIFSLGKVPFFDSSWTTEFENQLEAGMRLWKPHLAQQAVYNWMMSCWDKNPDSRPTFSECEMFFKSLGVEPNAEQD